MDEIKIKYNDQFGTFLKEYDLSEDFNYHIYIPKRLKEIIDSPVISSEYGITLQKLNPYEINESCEKTSIEEDFENHFHIDLYVKSNDNKRLFMLGVKTLHLLSRKFIAENYKGVRFKYSFQTPELAEKQSRLNGLHEENDEYYISDRLSFYRIRQNEILLENLNEFSFEAVLIIDI